MVGNAEEMDYTTSYVKLGDEKKNSPDVNNDGKHDEMPKSGKRKITEIMLKNIETNNYRDKPYDKDE